MVVRVGWSRLEQQNRNSDHWATQNLPNRQDFLGGTNGSVISRSGATNFDHISTWSSLEQKTGGHSLFYDCPLEEICVSDFISFN